MVKGQLDEAVTFLRQHGFTVEALGAGLWHVANGVSQGPGKVLELELTEGELLDLYRRLLDTIKRGA